MALTNDEVKELAASCAADTVVDQSTPNAKGRTRGRKGLDMDAPTTECKNGKKSEAVAFYNAIGFPLQMSVECKQVCGQRWGATLEDADGRRISLHPDWQTGERLQVSGDWPRTKDGQYAADGLTGCNPEITVAITRSPEAIAKDIQRRFLDDFRKRWDEVAKRVTESDAYTAAVEANTREIVSLIEGASMPSSGRSEPGTPLPYRHCRVSRDEVELAVYLPIPLARTIINLVEVWRKDHPE